MSGIPPAPPVPESKPSSRATTSLVLGILGFVCCQLCAPFAWYMGHQEMKAIKVGQSSAAGQGFATAGMILGVIGTILLVFAVLWIFFFGGMAILAAMSGASGAAQ
jgi:hypothetical protein